MHEGVTEPYQQCVLKYNSDLNTWSRYNLRSHMLSAMFSSELRTVSTLPSRQNSWTLQKVDISLPGTLNSLLWNRPPAYSRGADTNFTSGGTTSATSGLSSLIVTSQAHSRTISPPYPL